MNLFKSCSVFLTSQKIPDISTVQIVDRNKTIKHQLPNDWLPTEPYCHICHIALQEPFITCAECPAHLSCLKCFANGGETGTHLNTHSYIITHDNVKVFPNSNWSAREERRLLELLLQCGYGNWGDIAANLTTKTAAECRDHYHHYYFDGIFMRTLGLNRHYYWPETVPFMFKSSTVEPPRQHLDLVHSKHMAGYRFARSEFDTPYDVSAESSVSQLQLHTDWGADYEGIGDQLNVAVFNAYNNRLRYVLRCISMFQ